MTDYARTEREIECWDGGYASGYSEGFNNCAQDLISWFVDENYPEAAEALRYALTPEGILVVNQRIRELYGSLQQLAGLSRQKESTNGALSCVYLG